ncbi:MAG TPA: CYTH domain-containing protein [Candidatus Nanoarchaeia archaeon]|nr:inorganic triphosphatase [uncultured archaeon]
MSNEVERRFLVDINRLPKLSQGSLQVQGYFNNAPSDQPEIRIRVEESKATLTLKTSITAVTRQEFEYEIPLKDALALLSLTEKRIRKVRHHLKLNSKTWVIDFFQDENSPLVIAEIELKNEDEAFEKPLWTTKEVTEDLRFTAISLAFDPYSQWVSKEGT